MTRRLLNLLTLLSLLLCVAAVVLWAWTYDNWRVGIRRGQIVLYVARGDAGQSFVRQSIDRRAAERWGYLHRHASTSATFAGFEYHHGTTPAPSTLPATRFRTSPGGRATTGLTFPFTLLAIPLWPLLPLTLTLPAVRLWLARRDRRRVRQGRCRACGYDLRSTPDRCPECGTEAR